MLAYIGSRTTRGARGEGITVCQVATDGKLAVVQVCGGLANPSFLALNRAGTRLYTVHGDGQQCSVLAVHPEHGTLELLHAQACGGRNPVHLALGPGEQWLYVSNHWDGNIGTLPVDAQGHLGPLAHTTALPGPPGPHRKEQACSRPHFNPLDTTGRWLLVPDKGLDRTFVFELLANGRLQPAAQPFAPAREGAGPRHCASHPTGRWVYVVNELDNTVVQHAFDTATGALTPLHWWPLLPGHYTGTGRAAEVQVSQCGRWLYASNRGYSSIEVFAIAADTGALSHCQSRPSEGRTPRFFALHPQGHVLYALNEASHSVVAMPVNPHDGRLGPTRAVLGCGSPVCMVFRP